MQMFSNRLATLSDSSRLEWLLCITTIGLVLGLIMTHSAWGVQRTYPLSPIIPGFSLGASVQLLLFVTLLGGLITTVVFIHWRRAILTTSLVALLILTLLDITRLQPWILHYSAILLLFLLPIARLQSTNTQLLDAARLVVGGMYVWSGIQKMNLRFVTEIFPWFSEPLWTPFGEPGATAAVGLALLVPFLEVGIGIGLFSRRLRAISLLAAGAMLLTVLVSLGPTGHNWNSSVWPWNIALFATAVVLFAGTQFSTKEFIQRQKINYVSWAALALFWIVPAGNLIGVTDHYLSWSLYSGKAPEATLVGDQDFLLTLSPLANAGELTFAHWTLSDMNIVPYPEERVFMTVFTQLCAQYPEQSLSMYINSFTQHDQPKLSSYFCEK